jgi:hypothetical protein
MWSADATQWAVVAFYCIVVIGVVFKTRNVDFTGLLCEPPTPGAPGPGKASLSRLQLLLFTFIIIGLYLYLCLNANQLLDVQPGVLGLMGISGGSYVISKGIQFNGNTPPTNGAAVAPAAAAPPGTAPPAAIPPLPMPPPAVPPPAAPPVP